MTLVLSWALWVPLAAMRVGLLPDWVSAGSMVALAAVVWSVVGTGPSPAADLGISTLLGTTAGLVVASFGEEVGWRGVALPALVRRQGWSRASLTLGLFVALWHVPYWVLQGVFEDHGLAYLVLDFVFVVALTFQLSWLVGRSRWSVLVAVAFHVSFNVVNVALLPLTDATGAFAVLTGVEVVLAVLAARALRE